MEHKCDCYQTRGLQKVSLYIKFHSLNLDRSGDEEVDEREIFKGSENKLTMRQTYTHEFQCMYRLHEYPFDTQVML